MILTIVAAMVFALNIHFPSCNSKKQVIDNKAERGNKNSSKSPEDLKWSEGRSLFKSNCAACHNPKVDGTGPALKDVDLRWKAAGSFKGKSGEQWLKIWIRNWNEVVESGYKYGVDMANSRASQMNVFSSLSDEQIYAILFYVDNPDAMANRPLQY
ncbi:MAG: c-type cytochrome [Bacteroidota bacterium]|nr:c-type cytochrome [Bacteroidota bacterium]